MKTPKVPLLLAAGWVQPQKSTAMTKADFPKSKPISEQDVSKLKAKAARGLKRAERLVREIHRASGLPLPAGRFLNGSN
jgi:hypothetical protein